MKLFSLLSAALIGFFPLLNAQEEPAEMTKFKIEIEMECPMSPELEQYIKSVPTHQSADCEEWKKAFIENMSDLILLVESNKFCSSQWRVNFDQ